jgi:hypothetical protein
MNIKFAENLPRECTDLPREAGHDDKSARDQNLLTGIPPRSREVRAPRRNAASIVTSRTADLSHEMNDVFIVYTDARGKRR